MWLKAAASQTWEKGDMLTKSSGLIALATATSALLCGYAGDDRTSTTANDEVPVVGADDPNLQYIGRADADPSSTLAGAKLDLVGGTGAQMIDIGATTYDVFTFVRQCIDEADVQYAECVVTITSGKHDLFTT